MAELFHHREQILKNLQEPRSGRDQEHRWKNEEEDREDELDADLAGALLGILTAADAHEIGMGAERFRDAGAELVGLNENRNKLLQFSLTGSSGQIAEGLGTAL